MWLFNVLGRNRTCITPPACQCLSVAMAGRSEGSIPRPPDSSNVLSRNRTCILPFGGVCTIHYTIRTSGESGGYPLDYEDLCDHLAVTPAGRMRFEPLVCRPSSCASISLDMRCPNFFERAESSTFAITVDDSPAV